MGDPAVAEVADDMRRREVGLAADDSDPLSDSLRELYAVHLRVSFVPVSNAEAVDA